MRVGGGIGAGSCSSVKTWTNVSSEAKGICGWKCTCLHAPLCPTVCNPMDCSPPGPSVHGIFQARILEWVAISYSRHNPNLRIEPRSPAVAGRFFTTEPPGKPRKSTIPQSLCNPMDSSPPGSSVHGILQARMLEWVAIAFSRGSSNPGIKPAPLVSPAKQIIHH